jgi:uncharacterized protein YgbK (DUF1537 family)
MKVERAERMGRAAHTKGAHTMTITKTTTAELAQTLPLLAADLEARGFVSQTVAQSNKAACMWLETAKGGKVLAYGSRALFLRLNKTN